MNHVANPPVRTYRSEVRAQQADATRARILDATVRVMAGGVAYVSIPAVAREADVSVPTIYRHFGTKRGLIAAVYPHVARRAGGDRPEAPRSIDDLRDGVRRYLDHLDSFDDLARAAMASPASTEARRLSMPDRLAVFGQLTESVEPRLSEGDRARIARLLVVLTSSSALRMWRDLLGASVEETAEDVDWVVRAAVTAATSGDGR